MRTQVNTRRAGGFALLAWALAISLIAMSALPAQSSYTTPGGIQIGTPSVNANGNVCTTLTNPTAQSQTVNVKYLQAANGVLLADPNSTNFFGQTGPAATTVPAHGSTTVCFPPFVGGSTCNGFKICDTVTGNTIGFCTLSYLNPPAPAPPPPPVPATETITVTVTVESGAPNPATDTNIDITVTTPSGWSVNVQSSLPVPPAGGSTQVQVQITRPTNACGRVVVHCTFTGAQDPFATINIDLTSLTPIPGTIGTPGVNDATINGLGSGQQSLVPLTLQTGPGNLSWQLTSEPNSPTLGVISPGGLPGFIQIGSCVNSVDLNLSTGFSALWDGLGLLSPPTPLTPFFSTRADGIMDLTLSLQAQPGPLFAWQGAIISPVFPAGFTMTQAFDVQVVVDPNLPPGAGAPCNPLGTVVAGVGDDTSTLVPLGFTYMHYGVAYTDLFIGSNGFITFGVGDTDFTESVPEFLNNAPRIAMWWDDLSPNVNGTVNFYTDNLGTAEVCFTGVPEFGVAGGANSFNCILSTGSQVICDYGSMTALDGLVGLSPGNGLDPTGTALNLSLGSALFPPGSAPFEFFDATNNPNDLSGFLVTWILDANGNPIQQQ